MVAGQHTHRVDSHKNKLRMALKSHDEYPINLKWMVHIFYYKHISSLTTHLKRHFREDYDYQRQPDGKRSWSYHISLSCFAKICKFARHAKRQAVSKHWVKLLKKANKKLKQEDSDSDDYEVRDEAPEEDVDEQEELEDNDCLQKAVVKRKFYEYKQEETTEGSREDHNEAYVEETSPLLKKSRLNSSAELSPQASPVSQEATPSASPVLSDWGYLGLTTSPTSFTQPRTQPLYRPSDPHHLVFPLQQYQQLQQQQQQQQLLLLAQQQQLMQQYAKQQPQRYHGRQGQFSRYCNFFAAAASANAALVYANANTIGGNSNGNVTLSPTIQSVPPSNLRFQMLSALPHFAAEDGRATEVNDFDTSFDTNKFLSFTDE